MTNQITISFVGTTDLKAQLEQWAQAEDRSLSATLRRILEAEAHRREGQQNRQATRQEVKYQAN